jgi:hypothetical protein
LSQQVAERLEHAGADPATHIAADMRTIRLPRLDNAWQKPYLYLDDTWLNDPAIRDAQLPGYVDEGVALPLPSP